ncbi:hypothetical protein Scep_015349 [Stephania cephalantha]|uniref:Cytochrome P450 n=1 Tax=Stephania cephalantha TaxID=152367 RepID=A0AAP0P1A7_9MAGN
MIKMRRRINSTKWLDSFGNNATTVSLLHKLKYVTYYEEGATATSPSSSSSSSSSVSLLPLPPSPSSLPLLGHLHLVKKPLHRNLEAISRQYGPVVFLRFGSRPVILVSGPSTINECFTKNDVVFANRPQMLAAKHLNYNFTTIVSASYGSIWRNLRRFTILEIFSMARLHISAVIRREEVGAFVRNLAKNYSGEDSKRFDEWKKLEMKSRLNELVFNTMTKMIGLKRYFGEDVREEDLEEAKMFKEIMRESFELIGSPYIGDYLPFLRWLDFKGVEKRMIRLKRRRDEFLRRAVWERRKLRATCKANSSNSFSSTSNGTAAATTIDVLLSLQEREPDFYTDEIIHGIIMRTPWLMTRKKSKKVWATERIWAMVVAGLPEKSMTLLTTGTHTSAITTEWAMALMLNHPRTLAKARAEIDSQIGTDRLLQESDLPDLTYLNTIINETLRLFPPTAIIVPHEASSDCTVAGFNVPRGTMLLVNAWAMHRDPNSWPDPEEFKPERFGSENDDHENDFKFIPFGFGRRGCPGTRMAMRMIGLTLGRLVQCFEWERVGEEMVEMSEGPGITVPKVRPLEALYRPRQQLATVLEKC